MKTSDTDRILRRRGFGYWLRGLVTALFTMSIVLALAAGAGLFFLRSAFQAPGPLPAEKVVMVRKGMGLNAISRKLESEGAVSNSWVFFFNIWMEKTDSRLKAGEYRFKASASMQDIMDMLVKGRSIKHKFTVPEGLTSAQIVERLKANPVLRGEVPKVPAEGALMPETYVFQRGFTRAQLLSQMLAAQKKLITKLWAGRAGDLTIKTPREALILASIVEKETGVSAERARVAAVFINRLNKSIRLQSDPTIIYGLVGGKGPLGRPIRQSEIAKKTPYNTYQIDGLPPTPIANPGQAAIKAVLNPLKTNELFFVADGTGGHVFAQTLTEHKKNVTKWRKLRQQQKKAAQPTQQVVPTGKAGNKAPAN